MKFVPSALTFSICAGPILLAAAVLEPEQALLILLTAMLSAGFTILAHCWQQSKKTPTLQITRSTAFHVALATLFITVVVCAIVCRVKM